MRIAQVSPLFESVPPRLYGGTERIVSYLTEELVELGHEVTLFASGDSVTAARLVPPCARGLRLIQRPDGPAVDSMAYHMVMLSQVAKMRREFDLIHFHLDYIHYPLTRALELPNLSTLHGRLDLPDLVPLYRELSEFPLVSISDAQRTPLQWLDWRATVHHGLPPGALRFSPTPGEHVVFLGRFSPEKRPEIAIEMAVRAGIPIRIAAKLESTDRAYFDKAVRPLLSHPLVEYIGEISEREKSDFLGRARAVLFPVDWPEPFGLVMIEALACGTPVIAFPNGSVPEIVTHGRTGFLVRSAEQGAEAIRNIGRLRREDCRREFDTRFTARRMAEDYLRIYESVLSERSRRRQGISSIATKTDVSPSGVGLRTRSR